MLPPLTGRGDGVSSSPPNLPHDLKCGGWSWCNYWEFLVRALFHIFYNIYYINDSYFKKILFYFFFCERGREGKREGEKHQCERDILARCFSYAPKPRTWPTTHNHALIRN